MRSRSARLILFLFIAAAPLAACSDDSPAQPTDCSDVTLTPATFAFGASGGTGTLAVGIPSGCAWTAQSQASWITISSGSSGSGAGIVGFAVAEQTAEAPRTGTLAIAGRTATVTQAGRPGPGPECTYEVTPQAVTIGKDGGPVTVTVTTQDQCPWSASSATDWLSIASGSPGTGTGTVTLIAGQNRDAAGRTAVVTIAELDVEVTQEPDLGACVYSVTPVAFDPCMPATILTATVTAQAVCPWTATPGASWITVEEGRSGRGAGVVRFSVTGNYDSPRHGVVMVRWPTPSAGQNLQVMQAGCFYAVTQDLFNVPASGGMFAFDVLQTSQPAACGGPLQDQCRWSATSTAGWVVVTTMMPQRGDQRVSFTVAPNSTGAPRMAMIRVRDQVVQINQQ